MTPPPDTEALLAHAGWVRGLALQLVRDAAEAEDLAQDTLVAALEHPPRAPVAWRGYLRTVMRNAFLQRRRASERREARELASARAEGQPSAADSAERLAAHREIVAAVEALDEPYRQTVLLRYFDERPPRAIAERLGVPVKTVNTRLHRAHALLRARLDAQHGGDRRSWAIALAVLARHEPPAPAATSIRIALAATGLAVVVALGLWIARAGTRAGPEASIAGLSSTEGASAETDGLELPARAASRQAVSEPPRRVEMRGRVRTAAGEGIAGAEVDVRFRPADGMALRRGAYGQAADAIGSARSGADGRFELSVPEGRAFDVRVRAAGFGVLHRPLVAGASELDLVLAEAGTIAIAVRDPAGEPIAAVPIEIYPGNPPSLPQPLREPWILGSTDATGRWRSADVPPGVYSVTARLPNGQPVRLVNLAVHSGAVVEREIRRQPGTVLEGSVRSAGTGAPVAGAAVGAGVYDNRCALTDELGRFRIDVGDPGGGSMDVWASAQGLGDLIVRLGNSARRVDFELPRGRDVSGTLLSSSGAPLAGAWVVACAERQAAGDVQKDWSETRAGEDGRFTLLALRPDLQHALLVRSPGTASTIAWLPETGLGDPIDLGPVKVGASASLEGIAVRDDGTPAAGAVVVAKRIDDVPVLGPSKAAPLAPAAQASAGTTVGIVVTKGAPEVELEPVSSAAIPIGEAMETFAIAGDDGRFAILDLAEGRYRVHARIGWLRSTQREIDLAAGAIERELRFEIARGLSLSGTVVDDAGHPIPGGWVLLYREGEHLETRSLEADEEGRFRTDGLQEGRYRIDAGHQASSDGGELEHPYARASVADIVPPRSDVVVRLPRTIRIEGRVVDAGGNPLPYAIVQASDEDGRGYQGVVDAVGRFHLEVAPGSVLEIVGSWTGSVPEGDGARRLEAKLPGFVAGSQEILLRLE